MSATPFDGFVDRQMLVLLGCNGINAFGLPAPKATGPMRRWRRRSEEPASVVSMECIPIWACLQVQQRVERLPITLGVIVQRPRAKSWSIVLRHWDGWRLVVRVKPEDQTNVGIARVVDRLLRKSGLTDSPSTDSPGSWTPDPVP